MLLGIAPETDELFDQLFLRGFLPEAHKGSRSMSVKDRNAHALAGDNGFLRRNDHAVLYMSEDAQGFLLALLFLAGNKGNHVPHHLRPVAEGLARSGDRLIGGRDQFCRAELLPCRKGRRVSLDRAVGLHGDKSPLRAQSLLLEGNHIERLHIDLRHDHGDVRRPAVRAVVGYDRSFRLRVSFLDPADLILAHIDCGEDHVNLRSYLLHFRDVHHCHPGNLLRHRRFHLPAAADRLLIGFSGAARTRRQGGDLKIRMIRKQRDKTLAYHAGCSENSCFQFLFHGFSSCSITQISDPNKRSFFVRVLAVRSCDTHPSRINPPSGSCIPRSGGC